MTISASSASNASASPNFGRRIGLFGGGFDPIHNGHLHAARAARDAFALDTVIFIPTGVPPHKASGNQASAADRYAMTQLAIVNEAGFAVSDIETRSTLPSYTVDTLRALIAENPEATDWFFIFGDDCATKLHHWKGLDEMRQRVRFISIRRNNLTPADSVRDIVDTLDVPPFPAASSDIRRALASQDDALGESANMPVPAAVLSYIRQHRLYSTRDILNPLWNGRGREIEHE